MSKTAEEIEDLAIEYADSKERRMTSAWQGLKIGFIAGYSSKDARIKELEARLETAEKVIGDAIGNHEQYGYLTLETERSMNAFLTNKTE